VNGKPVAVVITALNLEFEAVAAKLQDRQEASDLRGTVYSVGSYAGYRIAVAEGGRGNVAAAVVTSAAIEHFQPDLVLFVGVAGGVKDVALGDVVVASRIREYEIGKDTRHKFLMREGGSRAPYRLEQLAKAIAREAPWSLPDGHRGWVEPIAAGGKVVASSRSRTAELLRTHCSDVVAVEMEGAGFLEALHVTNAQGLVVRGISDMLDNKSQVDKAGIQAVAADHAAEFAMAILARYKPTRTRARRSPGSASRQQRPIALTFLNGIDLDQVDFESRVALFAGVENLDSINGLVIAQDSWERLIRQRFDKWLTDYRKSRNWNNVADTDLRRMAAHADHLDGVLQAGLSWFAREWLRSADKSTIMESAGVYSRAIRRTQFSMWLAVGSPRGLPAQYAKAARGSVRWSAFTSNSDAAEFYGVKAVSLLDIYTKDAKWGRKVWVPKSLGSVGEFEAYGPEKLLMHPHLIPLYVRPQLLLASIMGNERMPEIPGDLMVGLA
jgi:5'-methylthioadenosine/S-adenosylhomocysteine nucleosidase